MRNGSTTKTKVAIAGLGAIGREVAKAIDGGIDGLELVAASAANIDKHRAWLEKLGKMPAALPIAALADGADTTRVQIWADPTVTRNTHRIEVESDSARFSMSIENIPSENPKTGKITALSVIACLRKLRAPLRIGT